MTCHIGAGASELHKPAVQAMLLRKTLFYLKEQGYILNLKDQKFLTDHWILYNHKP